MFPYFGASGFVVHSQIVMVEHLYAGTHFQTEVKFVAVVEISV